MHDTCMLRRIYQATMADQQPAAAAAAAPDAAAGGGESLLSHLRTLSTTAVTDLRQQAGGPAGVVETLAGIASSSFVKQGAGAPPFPVVSTSASSAPAPGGAADAGAGAGAGGRANAAAVASPQRQEECLLYLQTVTVHSSNLVGCIDSGIKLEAVATCVKVCVFIVLLLFACIQMRISWRIRRSNGMCAVPLLPASFFVVIGTSIGRACRSALAYLEMFMEQGTINYASYGSIAT